MTAAVRALLRSETRTVLIEAPAGCGKTHEAASLAMDAVPNLKAGERVLLLAHTNAAKEEFTRRTRAVGRRIEVSTIDSFCNRVLGPYAPAVNLPSPLDRNIGNRGECVPYSSLSLCTSDLFARSPTVARLLGKKYPLIIGDEHQDADANQHMVLVKMAEVGGSRLRLFGDPMQAIFDTDNPVSWDMLRDEADAFAELAVPKRWRHTEESQRLGEWIIAARQELRGGRPLPLVDVPDSVSIFRCDRTNGKAFAQGNPGLISGMVHQFIADAGQESLAVLAYANRAAMTIESAASRRGIRLNEGADYEAAYEFLERAIEFDGTPAHIASLLLNFVRDSSVGISQADHNRLSRMFEADSLVNAPHGRLEPLAAAFQPIYDDPSLVGLFQACRQMGAVGMQGFRLRKRLCLRLLAALTKRDREAARDELSAAISARKAVPVKPTRAASTIHKAKGLEFDHVLIAYCGENHFPDNEGRRKLLYVAISRAVKRLVLHVPTNSPSPLVDNP